MKLNEIQSTDGSRRERKRLGCGNGSGQGKTGGRGHKGQKSRSGGKVMRGFEGGQMPLIRRLPKRGFTPLSRNTFQIVNVADLVKFEANATVDALSLYEAGLIRNAVDSVKLLGDGTISVALNVHVTSVTGAAKDKIESAGGKVQLVEVA
ncbi:MAG: 50S ribosomal protein L15 [Zetaproteobacteria bacterium]|nr:50S ribosomal protein L15 [Zetaproteobacteria bacterium]